MSQETEENLSLLHFSQTFYLPFQLLLFVLALGLLLSSINIIEQGVDINGIKNNESEIICHFRAALEGIIDFWITQNGTDLEISRMTSEKDLEKLVKTSDNSCIFHVGCGSDLVYCLQC